MCPECLRRLGLFGMCCTAVRAPDGAHTRTQRTHLALGQLGLGDVDGRKHVLEEHGRELHVLLAREALQHHERRVQEGGVRPARVALRCEHIAHVRVFQYLEHRRGPLQHRAARAQTPDDTTVSARYWPLVRGKAAGGAHSGALAKLEVGSLVRGGEHHEVRDTQRPRDVHKVLEDVAVTDLELGRGVRLHDSTQVRAELAHERALAALRPHEALGYALLCGVGLHVALRALLLLHTCGAGDVPWSGTRVHESQDDSADFAPTRRSPPPLQHEQRACPGVAAQTHKA